MLYRGYYYDEETSYYYLQSRYYAPKWCRFINSDLPTIVKSCKNEQIGLNLFVYCNNDPSEKTDPTGLDSQYSLSLTDFKSDWAGRKILWHFLFGKGKKLTINNKRKWKKYMNKGKMCSCSRCNFSDEQTLKDYIIEIVKNDVPKNLKVGKKHKGKLKRQASLENGESIKGYNYLHGTNATVGGLELNYSVERKKNKDVYIIECVWHDIMDPNYSYDSDSYKAALANKLKFIKPKSYEISIKWEIKYKDKKRGRN